MNDLMKQVEALGYEVGWSSGATPEDEKQRQRDSGWLWEGDDIPEDFPDHLVLKDDSRDPAVFAVRHEDMGVQLHIREDDTESWTAVLEGHPERVRQASESREETMKRLGINPATEVSS